jgi:hypothetical protein
MLGKRWFKVLSRILILLILIPAILYGIFRSSAVQTWLTSWVTHYLSKELNATLFIRGVDISWFLDLELKGVFISDQRKDTLLYTPSLTVDLDELHYKSKILKVKKIALKDANIALIRHPGDSSFNFQFLVDYFASTDTSKTPAEEKWKITVQGIDLKNSRLQFNDDHQVRKEEGFDFNHCRFTGLNLSINHFASINDTLSFIIDHFACNEKSGFTLKKMKGKFQFNPHSIAFRDLAIRTAWSNIESDLTFTYPSLAAFNDFLDAVNVDAFFLPSEIDSKDLEYFLPSLKGMKERIILEGQVEGKINNLKLKDIKLDYGSFSRFRGNIKLTGLPDIEETYIQLNIKELVTNHFDLNNLSLPGGKLLQLPSQITEMGNIRINGNFTGFYNDFVSYAQFNSDLGSVFTDISLKSNPSSGELEYSGRIRTRDFNIGQLIRQQEYIGEINLAADLTGSGTSLDNALINIDGVVDSLYFKGNTFKEIKISGGIMDRRFNGNLTINDPLLGLEFDGFIDFKKDQPVFDFITNIHHAWLNQLNLVKSDSIMGIKTNMKIHFEGLNPDSVNGFITMDSTLFRMNRVVFNMKKLFLTVESENNSGKNINLACDYSKINITGTFKWDQIIPSVQEVLYTYLPALSRGNESTVLKEYPDLVFTIDLIDTKPFTRMFYPQVSLAKNTLITGVFHPGQKSLTLKAGASAAELYGASLMNWQVEAAADGQQMKLSTQCDHLELGGNMGIDHIVFNTTGSNDSLDYALQWKNESQALKNTGDVTGTVSVLGPSLFNFHINQSRTIINDSLWVIPGNNTIEVDSQSIRVQDLSFISGQEKIMLSGVISENPLDIMTVTLQDYALSNVNFLTGPSGFTFKGYINGSVQLMDLYKTPGLASDITVDGFTFNGDKLGNMSIHSRWDPSLQALFAKSEVIYKGNIGENKPIYLEGYYYPAKKDESLDFKIHIDNFKLKTIANFLSSFSSKFTGFASGDLTLKGNLREPDLQGSLKVQRGVIRVDYLKTEYSFSQEFEIGKNYIGFNNIVAYDSIGNKMYLNGKINHHYFNDFGIDLNIKAQNCLALNTQPYDNDLFYGRAFGTGEIKIHGPVDNIVIDINAKSEKGTQVNLPINTTADISDNEFIIIGSTDKDTTKAVISKPPDNTGVNLNLDLEATPDAMVRIFMPDDMGTIKANGQGKLKVGVDTRGLFTIYGDYQINEGSFLFTLQNVINRLFQIQSGGKIMFSGDPYATTMDIRAIHQLDVPLTGLRLEQDQESLKSKKIPMECIIDLKGNIFNPDLTFKLRTPERDQEINRILFSQLDTNNQQQMSEQMIFLMVLKQFKPVEQANPLDIKTSFGSSSWDIVSNQLNSWLSQISKDFDIGINYKPGDNNLSSDEITVALSTQLFNERVLIDGNLGYNSGLKSTSTSSQNASNLVGDVKVEVKLTRDGRIRVKAYNKSNNVAFFENNAPYTQGVGIFFRKEFDTLGELFKGKKKRIIEQNKEAVKQE